MIRCNVCGRSLVGIRADHPVLCQIETELRRLRLPCVELVGVGPIPDRVLVTSPQYAAMIAKIEAARYDNRNPRTILEGDVLDPLASEEERRLVTEEGPIERGARKNGARLRFAS